MWLRKLIANNTTDPKYTQLYVFKTWKEGDLTQRRRQGNHSGVLELCDHKPRNANKSLGRPWKSVEWQLASRASGGRGAVLLTS